jgi:alkanesulfonate monooxygenase SsuD/methylene tetrahydromethanopterin reductase-like flavin-dependent oxidoreductase (luciferase family)
MQSNTDPIRFGLNLDPGIEPAAQLVDAVRLAERSGFDLIGIQDHPHNPGFLETWTMLTHLAAKSERIAFTPNVANLGLRPPAMLAKAAATLAHLEGGRVVLGVGAGAVGPGVPSMGMRGRSGKEMRQYAEESVTVLQQALRGTRVQLESEQTTIRGYDPGPVPPVPVPVWMGSVMPKMLEVTGRVADGWLSGISLVVTPDKVPERMRVIDEAALAAGRDPSDIRRIYNVAGTVGSGSGPGFSGSAIDWTEWMVDWVRTLGFDGFVFWPMGDHSSQTELFGNEVIPRVREELGDVWGNR